MHPLATERTHKIKRVCCFSWLHQGSARKLLELKYTLHSCAAQRHSERICIMQRLAIVRCRCLCFPSLLVSASFVRLFDATPPWQPTYSTNRRGINYGWPIAFVMHNNEELKSVRSISLLRFYNNLDLSRALLYISMQHLMMT